MGHGADAIVLAEEDELAVDEVGVVDAFALGLRVIEEGILVDAAQPLLPFIGLLFRESQVYETSAGGRPSGLIFFVHVIDVTTDDIGSQLIEVDLVDVEVGEVLLGCS